jgi:hypothetical protein
MTINKGNSKILLTFICVAGMLTLVLSSCLKTSGNYTPPMPVTTVAITQASPDEPALDVFINGIRVNQSAVTFGLSSAYIPVNAGKNSIAFNNDATLSIVRADTINLLQNTNYSLFLVNTVSQPGILLLTDTLNKPSAGNAAIRFINLSPDAQSVDLVVKGGATLVSNRSFKGYSSFLPIQVNTGYTFEVHKAGSGTVLATLPNINLTTGGLYTIWFHGLAGGSTADDKLAIDIITNAYL